MPWVWSGRQSSGQAGTVDTGIIRQNTRSRYGRGGSRVKGVAVVNRQQFGGHVVQRHHVRSGVCPHVRADEEAAGQGCIGDVQEQGAIQEAAMVLPRKASLIEWKLVPCTPKDAVPRTANGAAFEAPVNRMILSESGPPRGAVGIKPRGIMGHRCWDPTGRRCLRQRPDWELQLRRKNIIGLHCW